MKKLFVVSLLLSAALSAEPLSWQPLSSAEQSAAHIGSITQAGMLYHLDQAWFQQAGALSHQTSINLPTPDGQTLKLALQPSVVMPSALQARYPNIRSYIGYRDNSAVAAITLTPKGISALYQYQGKQVLLSPLGDDKPATSYIAYYRKDAVLPAWQMSGVDYILPHATAFDAATLASIPEPSGEQIYTFRLALSASGEYSDYHGGTVEDVLAEYVTLVTRINQILLTDLAIQLQLVADTDQLIYLDAETDPFTNEDAAADLDANQAATDQVIGSANYDIGHLLNTNPGGLAAVGALCIPDFKAQGYTGNFTCTNCSPPVVPEGESFYIDLVAHELGHQLGAFHSFNGDGSGACVADQRTGSEAYEPGSGSTIMAYAGICEDQDLQDNSDAYFHAGSIEDIRDAIMARVSFASCGLAQADAENPIQPTTAPEVDVSSDSYVIPANTPFVLTATATDADGDSLSYAWEQLDAGNANGGTADADEMQQDNGANPLFRSFSPTSSGLRYFPQLSDVLGATISFGEVYPALDRTLHFRVTVRDGNGGVNAADVSVDVVDTGTAFSLTTPAENVVLEAGNPLDITWQTGDSAAAPINCAEVELWLDVAGEHTFTHLAASGLNNDGQARISVPNIETDAARFMLKCADNVFFAVNPSTFAIEGNSAPVANDDNATVTQGSTSNVIDVLANDSDADGDELQITGFTYSGTGSVAIENQQLVYTPEASFSGVETFDYNIEDAQGLGASATVTVTVNATQTNDPGDTTISSNSGGGGAINWLVYLCACILLYRTFSNGSIYAKVAC